MYSDKIDLTQKKTLLAKHPCFSNLTPAELDKLSTLLVEKRFAPNQAIVKEDDLVDSVYFIAQGTTEVRHIKIEGDKTEIIPLATLNAGEAIGLSETGFYSMTGKRTATVIALTECLLLRLDLFAFYEFTQSNPSVTNLMRDNAELLLRMKLIKQAVPFAKLSMENMRWLANKVKQKTVAAGEIIFQKGDRVEQCYLIQSGKVEIFSNDNGIETRLALLKSSMIFGEAALFMDLPRNASARALKDCSLLVLNRDALTSVIKAEKKAPETLLELSKNPFCPKRFPYVETFANQTADQDITITLKDTEHANYYRLSEEGFFIWQLLDGEHTVQDIASAFDREYDVCDPMMVSAFILDLADSGFVEKNLIHKG